MVLGDDAGSQRERRSSVVEGPAAGLTVMPPSEPMMLAVTASVAVIDSVPAVIRYAPA